MTLDLNTGFSPVDSSNNSSLQFGEGMLPSTVNDNMRTFIGAVKRWYDRANSTAASTGTANAQVISYTVPPTSLIAGDMFAFIVGAGLTNTGSTTLNVGTGVKTIKSNGANLIGGELLAGGIASVMYDGTNFQVVSRSTGSIPGGLASGAVLFATGANSIGSDPSFFAYNSSTHNMVVLGQGSQFGLAAGSRTAPTTLNTNIVLYNNGTTNWSGIGSHTDGSMYFVTGVSAPTTRLFVDPSGNTNFLFPAIINSNTTNALQIQNGSGTNLFKFAGNNFCDLTAPSARSDGTNLVFNAKTSGGLYLNNDVTATTIIHGPLNTDSTISGTAFSGSSFAASGTVSGATVTASGNVNGNILNTSGNVIQCTGNNLAARSTPYHIFYAFDGNPGIYLGSNADPTNYFRNTNHYIQNTAGTVTFLAINSTGISTNNATFSNNMSASSVNAVNIAASGNLSAGSTITGGTVNTTNLNVSSGAAINALTVTGGGTSLYANSGNIQAAGALIAGSSLAVGTTASIGGQIVCSSAIVSNAGGDGIVAANGDVRAAGQMYCSSTLSFTAHGGAQVGYSAGGVVLNGVSANNYVQVNDNTNIFLNNSPSVGFQVVGGVGSTYSDRKLKTNIMPLAPKTFAKNAKTFCSLIEKLNPVTFAHKSDEAQTERVGLIAQEVQEIFPHFVDHTGPMRDDPEGWLTVQYSQLVMPLIGAVQELTARLAKLEQKAPK